jgi:2,3-dihydroxybiphenyl 1,2-dioxygenase
MAIDLQFLGYVGLSGQDLPAWRRFSERLLGTQACVRDGAGSEELLALRMDGKCHRFILSAAKQADAAYFGLQLADEAAIDRACAELRKNGIQATDATASELAVRRVRRMAWLRDPDGNRLELYCGLEDAGAPLRPDRPIGGFRTGALGLGHVVFIVENLERARDFYCDVLGFKVSDYVLTPNRRVFLHINGRHHTVALAERAGGGIAHLMVEVNDFDDVGRAYDVALTDYPQGIYSTLGRHSNDHVTSFYVMTPAGIPLEYGWGGRVVDDRTWQVQNLFGPSLWGHDRVGGTPAARAAANEQRQIAFREGLRAPLAIQGDHGVE